MFDLGIDSVIEAMASPIKTNANPIHHKTKDRGSIIDKHRSEILILHNKYQCSYGEINFWLKEKHNISISKTALYNRVQHWKRLGIDG